MPATPDTPDWQQICECYRVLKNCNSNIVHEILRQSDHFKQWDHYPKGDVFDKISHSQYYYHAHPRLPADIKLPSKLDENGHFHLFMRKKGIPPHIQAMDISFAGKETTSKKDDICHLISISMNHYGFPIRLFTTNRWVTGETWYQAPDVVALLDYFNIDHAYPSWPLNLWISSMVRIYKDAISRLIYERDASIAAWQQNYPHQIVYEDRRLEITSIYHLSPAELALHR